MESTSFDLASVVAPYTMATCERVQLVMSLCEQAQSIEGDFVECGCCNGGLSAVLAYYAALWGRKVWLFDSFAGLPPCGANDLPSANGNSAESEVGKCVGLIDKVEEVIGKVGVDAASRCTIVKGWFEDTFTFVNVPKIAVLLLDSDWYASELMCLRKFYDCVVPGGFVYIDDYFYWPGCQQAATDFFALRTIPEFNRVGHSAWIQKGQA